MRNLNNKFENKKINYEELLQYGFKKEKNKYIYKTQIQNNKFEVNIIISEKEKYARLIDLENETDFILVDIENSTGKFVGELRNEYENIIEDIISKCTSKEIFKTKQSQEIISYIKEKYKDDLEFLWEKFQDNAIWRNKDNNKWYGVLLIIPEKKLGLNSDNKIEIIDLRYQKEKIENIVDNIKVFQGYHMNKKSWITIKLDDSMDTKEIIKLIDNSYNLSIGNKCGIAGESLAQKVYDYLTTIPKGKVVTYKQVAESLGNKGLARAVGNILHKNPDEHKYPCYKVLNSKGELAESFVFGGKEIQKEKLEKDGIKVINNKVDLNIYQWKEEKGVIAMNYEDKKIVGIIASNVEPAIALNVIGHMAISIGKYSDEEIMGQKMIMDKSGIYHLGISKFPFIITKVKSGKLKNTIDIAKSNPNIIVADYPKDMLETRTDEELVTSMSLKENDKLEYLGAVLYGNTKDIDEITGKFQLWRID